MLNICKLVVSYRGTIQSPRLIIFTATDNVGDTSMEARAIVNFESIDNPPMVDLNGNLIAGVNFSTMFTEGSSMIPVRSMLHLCYQTFMFCFCRLLVLKPLSLMSIQKNFI